MVTAVSPACGALPADLGLLCAQRRFGSGSPGRGASHGPSVSSCEQLPVPSVGVRYTYLWCRRFVRVAANCWRLAVSRWAKPRLVVAPGVCSVLVMASPRVSAFRGGECGVWRSSSWRGDRLRWPGQSPGGPPVFAGVPGGCVPRVSWGAGYCAYADALGLCPNAFNSFHFPCIQSSFPCYLLLTAPKPPGFRLP